ncbi:MAG TPA: hypothetical protein VM386_07620, partial [Acidimicrobiales bacterium]|nr:hypothetical protein [Acidimicrobiales bacterium]
MAGGLILPTFMVLGGFAEKASAEAVPGTTAGAASKPAKERRPTATPAKAKADDKATPTRSSTKATGATSRSTTAASSSKEPSRATQRT